MAAAGNSGTDVVKMLVARGISVRVERNGSNAVVLAASAGCIDTLRYLLANGADVNAKDSEGTTALMVAAGDGQTSIVQLLLDAGADLDAKNAQGDTAWLRAGMAGNMEIVDLFKKVREKR